MAFLHSREPPVVHRDLKSHNVLLRTLRTLRTSAPPHLRTSAPPHLRTLPLPLQCRHRACASRCASAPLLPPYCPLTAPLLPPYYPLRCSSQRTVAASCVTLGWSMCVRSVQARRLAECGPRGGAKARLGLASSDVSARCWCCAAPRAPEEECHKEWHKEWHKECQRPRSSEERPSRLLTVTSWPTGTPNYMAPELLLSKAYSTQVDVFAFAVLLNELFTREALLHRAPSLHHIPAPSLHHPCTVHAPSRHHLCTISLHRACTVHAPCMHRALCMDRAGEARVRGRGRE